MRKVLDLGIMPIQELLSVGYNGSSVVFWTCLVSRSMLSYLLDALIILVLQGADVFHFCSRQTRGNGEQHYSQWLSNPFNWAAIYSFSGQRRSLNWRAPG